MSAEGIDPDLAEKLRHLEGLFGREVPIERVAEVVHAVLSTTTGELSAADLRLYQELESLAAYINTARAEIAALRPQDIQQDYIPSATDELDAIVDATEAATNQILDAAEAIERATRGLPPDVGDSLADATTRIYEACNFQDITGQRITKVVKALKHIETEVSGLMRAFAQAGGPRGAAAGPVGDEALLNGPQLPQDAARQADVDALLADRD